MKDDEQFYLNAETEESNIMAQTDISSDEPTSKTNPVVTEPAVNTNPVVTEPAASVNPTANASTTNSNPAATEPTPENDGANSTTDPMLNRYRNGFKVAINYIYHHHPEAERANFRAFLEEHIPAEHVEEAISLKSNMEDASICPPGTCPNGAGGCDLCTFDLAFDETYFS